MPLMDEFREERERIKNADLKTKLNYFWEYYKLHTIAVISCVAFLSLLIYSMVTSKDYAFFAAMVNSVAVSEEDIAAFKENYVNYAEIDLKEYEVQIDSSLISTDNPKSQLEMNASQKLMAYTSVGQVDVIVSGEDAFPYHASQGNFYDLREILTPEQLAKYEPYFYYVDQVVLDARNEMPTTGDFTTAYPDMPDPRKPEEMEQPIPVALFVTDRTALTETYFFEGDYVAVGVVANSSHLENAIKFIDFLFEQNDTP